MDVKVLSLSSLVLDRDGPLRREPPHGARIDGPDDPRFDRHTVVYDAFRTTPEGPVHLLCPRLLGLTREVRAGLRVDGQPPRRWRHRRFLRHEEIVIPAEPGAEVSLSLAGQTHGIDPVLDDGSAFAGLDCLVAIQKDNRLDWITEWARYHAAAHGVGGILLFDNGSTDPGPETIAEALAAVPGLRTVRVVQAPFAYGVKISARLSPPAQYLQQSMLNLARQRFLRGAAGVLGVDIDELVMPLPSGTVFDKARASAFGVHVFRGIRAYPDDPTQPASQSAHGNIRPGGGMKMTKWCIIPGRVANRFPWAVHRSGGPFTGLSTTRAPGFWHCEATTTNWKGSRLGTVGGLTPDPALRDAIDRYLGPA